MNKYIAIAVAVVLSIVVLTIWLYGNSREAEGVAAQEAKTATAVIDKVKKHEKNKQELIHLNDDELVRRYCKWVYGVSYDECVRTVTPVD